MSRLVGTQSLRLRLNPADINRGLELTLFRHDRRSLPVESGARGSNPSVRSSRRRSTRTETTTVTRAPADFWRAPPRCRLRLDRRQRRARRLGLNGADRLAVDEQQVVGPAVPGGHDELQDRNPGRRSGQVLAVLQAAKKADAAAAAAPAAGAEREQ